MALIICNGASRRVCLRLEMVVVVVVLRCRTEGT